MDDQTQSQGPVVLIRKADGTVARVPLSQVGLKSQPDRPAENTKPSRQTPPQEVSPQPQQTQPRTPVPLPQLPAKQEPHALAVTAPVTQIFVDEAKYKIKSEQPRRRHVPPKPQSQDKKSWQREDSVPLLEERLHTAGPHSPVSHEVDEQFQRVLRKMPFPLPTSLQERVRSLILSRLKDVRTDEQIVEYAQQPIANGGLALSQVNAEALVQAIRDGIAPPPPMRPVSSDKKDLPFVLSPTIEEEVKLMTRTSVKRAQKHSANESQNFSESLGKPVIHDVTPAVQQEKRTVGPVEELHQFSRIDFERLAPTPEIVVMKLKEKFLSLKQESFLLFLDARRAWQESPLYREYQQQILKALQSGKSLQAYLAEQKKEMTFAQMQGVVSLNREVL